MSLRYFYISSNSRTDINTLCTMVDHERFCLESRSVNPNVWPPML